MQLLTDERALATTGTVMLQSLLLLALLNDERRGTVGALLLLRWWWWHGPTTFRSARRHHDAAPHLRDPDVLLLRVDVVGGNRDFVFLAVCARRDNDKLSCLLLLLLLIDRYDLGSRVNLDHLTTALCQHPVALHLLLSVYLLLLLKVRGYDPSTARQRADLSNPYGLGQVLVNLLLLALLLLNSLL